MVELVGILGDNATKGEKRFYSLIKSIYKDDSDVFCYLEPPIGKYRPDFLLIGIKIGIIIVEIKDYLPQRLNQITSVGDWTKFDSDGTEICLKNPFDQIYQYWRNIKDRINHHKILSNEKINIKNIVVFSEILENSKEGESIQKIAPESINLFFSEILSDKAKFRDMMDDLVIFNSPISPSSFNLLRANLIPTCRLPDRNQIKLSSWFKHPDRVRLLDIEQEKLAHELGEGHRIFYGVAGSGKTVLLVARTIFLAKKYPNWKILVLCYNKILAIALHQMINPQDLNADITIANFHKWARQYIRTSGQTYSNIYDNTYLEAKKRDDYDDFFQKVVPELLDLVIKDSVFKYDAILIDEGQDFEEEWYKSIIKCLNPETNSLLITLDGLQGIYAKKKLIWSDVGIDARGRVKKFRKSYRNPIEVGTAATKILPKKLIDLTNIDDDFLKTEEYLGIEGGVELNIANSNWEEYHLIIKRIKTFLKEEVKILILMRKNYEKRDWNHPLFRMMKIEGIEWGSINNWSTSSRKLLIGTLHGTKGLESEVVIIPELENYKTVDDRQLLYVGMTRTIHRLILVATKSTVVTDILSDLKKKNIIDPPIN